MPRTHREMDRVFAEVFNELLRQNRLRDCRALMIVGEAPGAEEDHYGRPFIGKAGQILATLLTENGFKREEIYITNAAKCRPPKNRDPKAAEIKACRQYLKAEIEAVQPRLIVSLGNNALKSLTGETGISKHRGSVLPLLPHFEASDCGVFVATHPAAALHYPHFIEQIRDDLGLLRKTFYGEFVTIETPWSPDPWPDGVPNGYDGSQMWSFDLETNASETRDPFAKVYLCGIDDGRSIKMRDDAFGTAVLLRGHTQRLVGHNSSRFDRLHLRKATGIDIKCDDTMLMGWLLHEEWGPAKRLNLESLCVGELGVEPWKRDVTWDWRKPTTIPWDEAKAYCAHDTRLTRMLAQRLIPQLQEQELYTFYDRLLLPASRALADMEERGLVVIDVNVRAARAFYEEKTARFLNEVKQVAANYGLESFNPGSTKQVGQLLFDKLGYFAEEFTPTGAASTNVGVIKTLRENLGDEASPVLDATLRYRKCRNKMLGTYIAHYENERDYFGRWYPWYSLTQTATGRTSGSAQQIPRGDTELVDPGEHPMIRRCVGGEPGEVILDIDFAQLEMRVAASRYVFDEPNLRAAFEQNLDVHLLLASTITGKPLEHVTKTERQNAKPPNFLFLYGGEEDMYRRTLLEDQDIVKSWAQANHERNAFFARWSGLPAGHVRVIAELQAAGRVRTLFGTLRRLPNVYSEERKVRVESFRQAVNAKVQTPACHMALIGLVLLTAAGFKVRSFQHDAYLVGIEDSEAVVRRAAAQIKELLERGVPEVMASTFGIDWDVPLKVDMKCGTAWTENDRGHWLT
jgi:DNA polymerase-1